MCNVRASVILQILKLDTILPESYLRWFPRQCAALFVYVAWLQWSDGNSRHVQNCHLALSTVCAVLICDCNAISTRVRSNTRCDVNLGAMIGGTQFGTVSSIEGRTVNSPCCLRIGFTFIINFQMNWLSSTDSDVHKSSQIEFWSH